MHMDTKAALAKVPAPDAVALIDLVHMSAALILQASQSYFNDSMQPVFWYQLITLVSSGCGSAGGYDGSNYYQYHICSSAHQYNNCKCVVDVCAG